MRKMRKVRVARDRDGKLVRVGDEVFFKYDYEGTGFVLAIQERPYGLTSGGATGPQIEFVIGNHPTDPTTETWHVAARFSSVHMASVVRLSQNEVSKA